MQRQRVSTPRNVLPSAEVPQEVGAARLPHIFATLPLRSRTGSTGRVSQSFVAKP
jgi:hypothetical protein